MAFNSSFAGSSGIENFYNNSVDFGALTNAAATQDALEQLNAIKNQASTFNNVFSADAKAEMDKYRMEGQQNLHDAQMFSKNLGTAAGFLSSGVSAFGKAGGFDNLFGGEKSLDGYSYGAYGNLPGEYDGGDAVSGYIGNNGGFSVNPGQPSYYGLN